jgi:hypothetical protein
MSAAGLSGGDFTFKTPAEALAATGAGTGTAPSFAASRSRIASIGSPDCEEAACAIGGPMAQVTTAHRRRAKADS